MSVTHLATGWVLDSLRRDYVSIRFACGLAKRLDDASTGDVQALDIPTCPRCAVLWDAALEGRRTR